MEEEEEAGCEFGGSRFPRDVGRKVPAGPVLSPRQDDQPAVSNIKPTCTGSLSSTRYPNLPSDRPTEIPPRIPPRIPLYPRVTTAVCHQNLRLVGLPPRSLHLTRFPLERETFLLRPIDSEEREREKRRLLRRGCAGFLRFYQFRTRIFFFFFCYSVEN